MTWFWIFMLVMDLLLPVTMTVFGWVFLHHPPKKINWAYGYRTTRSMRNEETWKFAHEYCGKIWKWAGIVLMVVTVVVFFFLFGRDDDTVGTVGGILCMLQMVPLLGSILPTEWALKRKFETGVKKV